MMLKRNQWLLCLLCSALFLCSCNAATEEQDLPLSYYYLPSYTVAVGTEADGYAVLETPLVLEEYDTKITSGACNGPSGLVTFRLDALSDVINKNWRHDLADAVLKIGNRQSNTTIQKDNTCTFTFTDKEARAIPITPNDLSGTVQLVVDDKEYPLKFIAVQPADTLEELGTVARDKDLAVLFIPEADGMVIKAFYEKPVEAGLRVEAEQVKWVKTVETSGNESMLPPPLAGCDYVPLTLEQQKTIDRIIIPEISLVFQQQPGQTIEIPLAQLEELASLTDDLKSGQALNTKEYDQTELWQFMLFERFPMQLSSAEILKTGVYAGQWQLNFLNMTENQLQLEAWQAEEVQNYTRGQADGFSLLGMYLTKEHINNDTVQLTIFEVSGKQYGSWVYE